MSDTPSSLASKFIASLLGGAIGDCVGWRFEFSKLPHLRGKVSPTHVDAVLKSPCRMFQSTVGYSDDTDMTIGVGLSLREKRGFDAVHMANVFAQREGGGISSYYRGYGKGTRSCLEAIRNGKTPEEAANATFGGEGSYGNGAAMRAAPGALFTHVPGDLKLSISQCVEMSRDISLVTHRHPIGVDGAVAIAVCVAYCLHKTPESFSSDDMLSLIRENVQTDDFIGILDDIPPLLKKYGNVTIEDMVQVTHLSDGMLRDVKAKLGNISIAQRSVGTAIFAFLRHPTSFVDVLREAIFFAGDTDTIASMACNICGALVGLESVKKSSPHINKLLPLIQDHDLIVDVATDLCKIVDA